MAESRLDSGGPLSSDSELGIAKKGTTFQMLVSTFLSNRFMPFIVQKNGNVETMLPTEVCPFSRQKSSSLGAEILAFWTEWLQGAYSLVIITTEREPRVKQGIDKYLALLLARLLLKGKGAVP
jgi:hypothetical protein